MKKKKSMRIKKRMLSFAMALVLVLQLCIPVVTEVEAATIQNPWDGESMEMPEVDEDGTYLIKTGAQLAWFAAEVNGGNAEINGKLMNYIYLNSYNTNYNWTMIGESTEHPYKGIFDGNGQNVVYMRAEISNKTDSSKRYAGLFGVVDGGTVKNLTVLGKVVHGYATYGGTHSNDSFYTGSGGIVGYLKSGQIINCTNYARTTMDGDTLYRNAGGIVGINKGLVMHCENQGKLSTVVSFAQNHIGGIAGLTYGASAKVKNSANKATVQGYICVGGIAGAVKGGAEINGCCNYGTIKGNSIIGGIAGRVSTYGVYSNGTGKECLVQNVYNLGNLTGYGNSTGTEMGGIAGEVGYESYTQEALPPMPVIQNAYSAVSFTNLNNSKRGSIVGYLLSGCYGTVYGCLVESDKLNPIGAKSDRSIKILGESQMLTENEMKSKSFLKKLGSAFTMSNSSDDLNNGYPKLTWQSLPSELLEAIDAAQLELNSWISESNQKKYGKNYSKIETIVETYNEKLNNVTNEDDVQIYLEAARVKLSEVKPAKQADSELLEAIDNGIIALEEYHKKLLDQHTDLTESQTKDMNTLLKEWTKKLEEAEDLDSVRLLIRDGKDAFETRIASYEEDKRLEEVRANAIQVVTDYRADESYEVVWMHKIKLVRDAALTDLKKAEKAADVVSLMEKAKNDIDAVIDQIPEAGAWDGKTITRPKQVDGIYQITSGSELAWFADQINKRVQITNLNAVLCNDISLGFKNWTPIGSERAFLGSFDGNGYTIRGLYIDSAYTYAGLFGIVGGASGQLIQNFTVNGSISVDKKVGYAAGAIAYTLGKSAADPCLVTNVHSNVSISVKEMKTLDAGVGGIIGKSTYTTVTNCSNNASVSILSESKGGITYYTGGLIGNAGVGTKLQTSYNSGSVWCAHTAGGLVGAITGASTYINSCYNTGDVTGVTSAGGLCGNVISSGNEIKWCYTSGSVNLNHSGRALGALIGTLATGKYSVLYALKRSDSLERTLVGTSADFSATGKFLTADELQSDDILNALNGGGDFYIHDYLGFQNGYPMLNWQMTLEDFKTGAIASLKNYVKESDYSEENWSLVSTEIETASKNIKAAKDVAEINNQLTNAKMKIDEIETKEGTKERILQEKREEAVSILENYVDLTVYREEEQAEIRDLIANATKYIYLADSIEEVERHLNEARENIDRLPDAFQYTEQLNMAAAAQVDGYIMNIGEVIYTAYVKLSIQIARNAYDSLTEKQKDLVTTYQILVEAEEKWEALAKENEVTEEDMNLAAEVDSLIEKIGTVTLDSKEKIENARLAYDSLTSKQQTVVGALNVLLEAEETYDTLCAAEVTKMIAAIGKVTLAKKDAIFEAQNAYNALSEKQKKLVKSYKTLNNAIMTYNDLLVVEPVIKLIDEIGEVSLKKADKITAAIYAYNKLTGNQQEMVNNYDVLQLAMDTYDSLIAVQNVMLLISKIGTVSKSSEKQIHSAREAYEQLDKQEKKQVTNLEVLENAEKAFQALNTKNDEITNATIKPNKGTLQDALAGAGSLDKDKKANSSADKKQKDTSKKKNASAVQNAKGEAITEDQEIITAEGNSALPVWLQEELNNSEVKKEDDQKVKENLKEVEQKKAVIFVLSIVVLACSIQIGTFTVGFRKAFKKRKEKLIRYE